MQLLQITLRDKWRLPLILVRVSKSLPLRESDAKIWACFVHNKTNEELVNFVATALTGCIPSETKQVLRSTAHAALLPERCPFPTSGPRSSSLSGAATPMTLSGRSTPITISRQNSSTPSPESSIILLSQQLQLHLLCGLLSDQQDYLHSLLTLTVMLTATADERGV